MLGSKDFMMILELILPRVRIEQYFQVQDYALWDVIEKYKDAKTLFAAIQKRFSGNEATKKTQKTLLKQMYGNFSAPSTKSLESIFNRLQKIASQLAILVSPIASASVGAEGPIAPKTTEQKLSRKNELKAKRTLMLAIPDQHLLKFHACKDANSL
ncbi:hypothetical protein Tco_0519649 [Tanacetum coccineum]